MRVDVDGPVRTYWRDRLHQHFSERYRGRALVKFPEDLRTYQGIIEATQPQIIIELGTYDGGSALWFADQLRVLCGGGRVISVDYHACDLRDERISFIRGDLRDVVDQVTMMIIDERIMVVDDSAHTFDITLSALRLYSSFVTKGCYFVVEDTIVDTDLSIWPDIKGAGKAVEAFLAENGRFVVRDHDAYGLTMHMGGWLEAIA